LCFGEEKGAHAWLVPTVSYDAGDERKQGHERDGDVELKGIGEKLSLSRGLWAIAIAFILAMVWGLFTLLLFVGHGDLRTERSSLKLQHVIDSSCGVSER
jgi:hypothetical protein